MMLSSFLVEQVKPSLETFLAIITIYADAQEQFFTLLTKECNEYGTDKKWTRAFYQKEIKKNGLETVVKERFIEPYTYIEKKIYFSEKKKVTLHKQGCEEIIAEIISHHILRRPSSHFFYLFSDRTPKGEKRMKQAYVTLIEQYILLLQYAKTREEKTNNV